MKRFLYVLMSASFWVHSLYAYTSYVSPTMLVGEGNTEYIFSSSYFAPVKRVNTQGEIINYLSTEVEIEKFSTMEFGVLARYGFAPMLEASVGGVYRQNQSTEYYDNKFYTFSKSGFESGRLQLRYAWPMNKGKQLAIEFNYRQAFYTNSLIDPANRTDIILGDDGRGMSLGGAMVWYTDNQNFFSTRFLYRNPGETLSSELFGEAEFAFVWKKSALIFGGEINHSLEGDPYEGDEANKDQFATGATNLYNSINRSWMGAHVGWNWAFSKNWRLEFKALDYIRGESTDLGIKYFLNFAYRKGDGQKLFRNRDSAFKEYTVEGLVTKVASNNTGVIVDKGIVDGLQKGMPVDFFYFDYLGGNELIASGFVVKADATKSMVKITRRFSKRRVTIGVVIRSGMLKEQ